MSNKLRQSEQGGRVPILKPADHQAGATGDSIKMANWGHVEYILAFGVVTGDAVLTVKSGATDGTQTTAETFHYRLADADQGASGADQFGAFTNSSSLTLTAATYDNRLLILELDAEELTSGQPFLTLAVDAAATELQLSVVALLSRPRYQAHDVPTAIP